MICCRCEKEIETTGNTIHLVVTDFGNVHPKCATREELTPDPPRRKTFSSLDDEMLYHTDPGGDIQVSDALRIAKKWIAKGGK